MNKPSNASKKMTKVVTASALGLALLAGGSTYALWSANATANTEAAITTGDLKVTASAPQGWSDVSNAAAPKAIASLADYRLAPGSTVQLKQDINTIVVGDNISGILTVKVPNTTTGAALAQGVYKLAVFDADNVKIGDVTADSLNGDGTLNVQISGLKQTAPEGAALHVELTVALPETADNATKLQKINLSNMEITLNQGPALATTPGQ